jgi:hypothetical protein
MAPDLGILADCFLSQESPSAKVNRVGERATRKGTEDRTP